jgi:hypothetical protein
MTSARRRILIRSAAAAAGLAGALGLAALMAPGPSAATSAPAAVLADSHGLPGASSAASGATCLPGSNVCITVTNPVLTATHLINVTAPSGTTVLFKIIPAFGNNNLSTIGVSDGHTTFNTNVDLFGDDRITVQGGSNVNVSLAGLNTTPFGNSNIPARAYNSAVINAGGTSTLTASNSGDNTLVVGPGGPNLLVDCNAVAAGHNTLQGDGSNTAAKVGDKSDTVTGVTKLLSCP